MTNPLVAEVGNGSTWHTGAQAFDYAVTAVKDIADGDYLGGGLNVLSAGIGALGAIVDPLGAVLAAGVGWLMEHVDCFREFLDWLAGKPDEITAAAKTWSNIHDQLGATAEGVIAAVRSNPALGQSRAMDAYRLLMADLAAHIKALSVAAGGMSTAVGTAGLMVATARTTVRDIIADAIGKIISKALQALTIVLIPKVAIEIGLMVSEYSTKIMSLIRALLKGVERLGSKMSQLKPVFDTVKQRSAKWDHHTQLAISRMRTGYYSANNNANLFNGDANALKQFSAAYGSLFRAGAGGDWSTLLRTATKDSLKGSGQLARENAMLNALTQTQSRTEDGSLNGGQVNPLP